MESSGSESVEEPRVDHRSRSEAGRAFSWVSRKRFVLGITVITIATTALWQGKLDGTNWVYAMAVVLAGHNAESIVRAAKQ